MSASKRKILSRPNALEQSPTSSMSGAEMLVLQQNIKQYIITRQLRPLTAHELEEFEKIKEQLLPGLLRYSQSAGSSLTEGPSSSNNSNSTKQSKGVSPHPSRKVLMSPQAQPEIYPTSEPLLSTAQPPGRAPTLSTHAKMKAGTKLKQLTLKPGSASLSGNLNQPQAGPRSTSASGVVTNATKGGEKKKRPRIDVYHDPENTDQKRRRRKTKADAGDSDKENRNPFEPVSPKQGKKVLGDNTNLTNNATKSLDPKGKNVIRKNVASKTSTANTTTTMQKATPGTQQQKSSLALPSIPAVHAATKATTKNTKQNKKSRVVVFQDTDAPLTEEAKVVVQCKEPSIRILTKVAAVDPPSISQHVVGNEPEESAEETSTGVQSQDGLNPVKVVKNSAPSAGSVNEVLASVADDDTTISFEPYVKLEGDKSPVVSRGVVEPEEVQGSEDSEVLYISNGSQEEQTFPMPEFLAHGAPKESEEPEEEEATLPMPGFLVQELPEDPQEAPTLPMPEFLQNNSLEEQDELPEELEHVAEAIAAINSPSSQSWEDTVAEFQTESIFDTETSESTIFVDGVWCISDYKSGVNTTVCGHKEQWIAVETNLHVQFWRLSGRESLSDSKWCRRVQLRKASNYPTQVIFAPDDSFAIVLNPMERSFIKVSLEENKETIQSEPRYVKVNWSGLMPSLTCTSFVTECANEGESRTSHQLVFGADDPGSICVMPIPDYDATSETKPSLKTLCYLGSNELASSIVRVDNTSSLVLASFGTAMVLWDLDDCSRPVSVADASFVLSPLPSPLPTAPSMAPSIMSATVPKQFFKEYEGLLQSKIIPPSNWPILTVLMMCDTEVDDSVRNESERCALYVIKGDGIELVHKYSGTQSISIASSSSRVVACQTKRNGKDNLCLWNILKPEAVIQLSLLDPPSQQDVVSQRQLQQNEIPRLDIALRSLRGESNRDKSDNEVFDTFSTASTLSPPPAVLSSSPYLPFDGGLSAEQLDTSVLDQLPEPALILDSQGQRQRQPKEWIDLTSVPWMGRKRVQFSVQKEQRWVVVVQHEISKQNSSVVHIMDLMSILSAAA
ncbi:hypothetical protein BGX26_007864 [Mortierella sp. AD094]|nr:hypothetical protein BGX26_007864 [Mortierella sp. AD094]